jgi:hypothetical protein
MVDRPAIVDAIRKLQNLYRDTDSISFSSVIQRTVVLAHGWYVAANRTATAIMLLETHGLAHEAAPLRRSLIEHAVGLGWLTEATEAAVDSLLRGYQERNIRRLKQIFEKESPEQAGMFNSILDIEVGESSEDHNLAFRHLCDSFGTPRIYAEWLRNTALSHATYASATAYIDTTNNDVDLSREPNHTPDSSAEIATMLLLASYHFNELLENRPWTPTILEVERQVLNAISADIDD